jgi:hypothetical protein
MWLIRGPIAFIVIFALSSCASVTVTKVGKTPKDSQNVSGVRYSLPKPFIQVIPQPDDTILVNVLLLPDSDNTYAIKTSSFMSSYSYQISINQNGTLSAVEFKKDTSIVGQQLATSAANTATQLYNIKTADILANQTAVNNAQANVDAAQSAFDSAAAQVQADISNDVTGNQLNADKATSAVKLAALQDAKAVFARVRTTSQVGNYTAVPGTPISTSNPTPTTGTNSGFGPQTWSGPVEYELPEQYGAVLYAVNEHLNEDGSTTLTLNAAKLEDQAQPEFKVAMLAAMPPTLGPAKQPIAQSASTATFQFTRAVNGIKQCDIFDSGNTKVTGNAKCDFSDNSAKSDHRSITLTLPTQRLSPGSYSLSVGFSYMTSPNMPTSDQAAKVSFTIQ